MHIEINPRSLLNLENICEVLYKLHPSVLNYLVDMQRTLGPVLGFNDMDNLTLEQRELFTNIGECIKDNELQKDDEDDELQKDDEDDELQKINAILKKDFTDKELLNYYRFNKLYKYLQFDTYEYIPIKIYVEVEDPVIGKKVRELVRALEKTGAPEQFYLNKREIDWKAYFAEGYNFSSNEEQKKKSDDIFFNDDYEALEKILIKEKLYP